MVLNIEIEERRRVRGKERKRRSLPLLEKGGEQKERGERENWMEDCVLVLGQKRRE